MTRACLAALIGLMITTSIDGAVYAAPSANPASSVRTPSPKTPSASPTAPPTSPSGSATSSPTGSARPAGPTAGPLSPGSSSGFGTHLQLWNSSTAFSIAVEGVESQANLPAMSTWTVEGWMFDMSGTCNSNGADAAWGLLSGTLPQANYSSPVAGIDFSPTNMGWQWPGGTVAISGTCGVPNGAGTGSAPQHYALSYDGQNVYAFVNGVLQTGFPVATTAAAVAAAPAGVLSFQDWGYARFDELRISNVARYTQAFTPPTSAFGTDANTDLLWHMDGNIGIANKQTLGDHTGLVSIPNFLADATGSFNGQAVTWGSGTDGIEAVLVDFYFRGQNPSAAELANQDEYCATCNMGDPVIGATGEFRDTFSDLNIPGRGYNLRFDRTYSSFASAQDGPTGFGWTDNFNAYVSVDGSGNVTVHEENGAQTSFTNNAGTYSAPGRVLATLALASGIYTYTRHDASQLKFDSTSLKLTSEVDRNGYTTTFTYTSGQLTQVADQAGRHLTFAFYSGAGANHIHTVTDPASRVVTLNYTNADGSGDLTSVVDVAGNTSSYAYSGHLLTTMKDAKCVATGAGCPGVVNSFDGASPARVQTQTDSLNRATQFAYNQCVSDPSSGITDGFCTATKVTHPAGDVEMQEYVDNQPVTVIKGYGTSQAARWNYRYDLNTLALSATTDPNGNSWSQTWDTSGNLLTKTDPLQRTTTYSLYNSFNEPQQVQDPTGVVTTRVYDTHGNLTQTSTPLTWNGNTQTVSISYGYTDVSHPGDLTQMTDQDAKIWHFTYDANGNRLTKTDPLNNLTKYFFDSVGRPTCMITPLGSSATSCTAHGATHVWTYATNAFGDMLSIQDPVSDLTQYQYDQNRNRSQLTDAEGNVSKFTYDFDNELTAEEDGFGTTSDRTLQTSYDADGRLRTQVDGLNNPATTYAYDSLGNLSTVTDPLNRVTTYTYDGASNRRSVQFYSGAPVTGYCYDAANQLTGISYSNAACGGTMDVSYAYYSDGLRHTMVDSTGTSSYVYDTLKRLRQMTNGAAQEVDYDYNLRGLLTQLTYPSVAPRNHIVTRAYDDAGRLAQVAVSTSWVAGAQPNNFTYDADSNLCLVQYGNGVYGSRAFDAADRLTNGTKAAIVYGTTAVTGCAAVTRGILLSLTYPRDANGQITAEGSTSYGYDPINRLTAAGTGSYIIDKADEMTQQPFPGVATTTFTYDAANQLKTGSVSGGGASYTYNFDSAGNRHTRVDGSGNTLTYNYDQLNRLTSFVPAGPTPPTYGFTYNGDGLRIAKSTNGSSTASFTWDVAEGLPLLLSDGSTSYVTGPGGLPIEQVTSSGAIYFYQTDQLGSTRLITNISKASVNTYTFDPYGNLTASTGSLANPFEYAGQYVDTESGLYYLHARYYDPACGQFASRDPAGAFDRQIYAYVRDTPLNATDPTGLDARSTYNFLESTVGYWTGHHHYYSASVGYNTQFGFGVTFGFTVTQDKLFWNQGFGFGSPGLSCSGSAGNLFNRNASQTEIDNYVSGPSLSGAAAAPGGAGLIWGNEGQGGLKNFGVEGVIGVKQVGVYQTNSIDVSDRQFWHQVLGPFYPIDAS